MKINQAEKTKKNHQEHFSFSTVELNETDSETDLLDVAKTIQQNVILVKIITSNYTTFSKVKPGLFKKVKN